MHFLTKARTLGQLEHNIQSAIVLPQFCFTRAQWFSSKNDISNIGELPDWISGEVIVRSSATSEDTANVSLAGHYLTIADVSGLTEINRSIDLVCNRLSSSEDEIFIQPMLKNVYLSGVAFSRDPNSGAHYYVVNYDDCSGQTDTVTSGSTNNLRTFYLAKLNNVGDYNDKLENVIVLVKELEALLSHDSIDVEFAIDKEGQLVLLQVRPLVLPEEDPLSINSQSQEILGIQQRIVELSGSHPYLLGEKTVFGVMPDWNPAEILGSRPRPLAVSLYKELITDSIWAYQRDNYGYRNLRSFPLLVCFAGIPYIDVRVSFNSFIPGDIPDELATKLVNHYIYQLESNPSYHDKVEFEIIYSCYTLDLPEKLNFLLGSGFTETDIETINNSLRSLTNNIIRGQNGLWEKDREKLSVLQDKIDKICSSNISKLDKIYWLIEDCKRYGTLPFAGLARAAFIAVQMLRSLVTANVLSESDYQCFMNSLDSISSSLTKDFMALEKEEFLEKYGHLRPGTYDILSPRYDEEPERYFDWSEKDSTLTTEKRETFSLSLEALIKLERLLTEHGLERDVVSFLAFIKAAIEAREYAKFVFTKSLSEVIRLVKEVGCDYGITADDLSYLEIDVIKRLYSSTKNEKDSILRAILEGKNDYRFTKYLSLPPLICTDQDVTRFELPKDEPNFVTLKSNSGRVVDSAADGSLLNGSILLLPNADPGFDWIFSHSINGFITKYGGANSHMAIRACELGIPAVIGAGEVLYRHWEKAKVLEINCSQRQVHILQ
ncbi:MAG: PEP-utilizing enzyme [Gammaproteobacteria bacterium]|nr:PEP-utilizing enzyme [Gammaproteobacteria bacterium]